MAIIDARERLRDAGQELEAGQHAQTTEGRIDHLERAARLILEAIAQVATVAGIAPLPPPVSEDDSDE